MFKRLKITAVAGALALGSAGASAALVTLPGVYFDLTYDDSALGAYGTPTLIGDLITFTPTTFIAESVNGNPATALDFTNSTVNLRINVHNGYRLQSIALSEGGDYIKTGSLSQVGVSGQTRALDLAQGVSSQIIQSITAGPFITNPQTPFFPTNPGDPSAITNQNWSTSTFTDLSGATYQSTQNLSYTIQNLLGAFTSAADPDSIRLAFIEKKLVTLDVNVSPVPEPEVWAMMLIGAGLVGFQLRRKSKQAASHRFV